MADEHEFCMIAPDTSSGWEQLSFPHRDWQIADFELLNQVDFSPCRSRKIVLRGKAPLWLYMFYAWKCAAAGAAQIAAAQAEQQNTFVIWPTSSGKSAAPDNAVEITKERDEVVTEFNGYGNLVFSPDSLPALLALIPPPEHSKQALTITGSMPTYLAAAAAVQAWRMGWSVVQYWSPRNSGIYRIYPQLEEIPVGDQDCNRNLIIGVVGDPNSGKSVFSDLLEQAGRKAGERIWKFDCDYAAPTPNWYLRMMRAGGTSEISGTALRKQYKRDWTHDGELQIQDTLYNLKRHAALTIADLPGGRHPKGGLPGEAQRIPPGREVMMTPIDFFIIIARRDRNSDELWRRELDKLGLGKRVLLTVWSEAPDMPPEISELSDGSIRFQGLSRETLSDSEDLFEKLWHIFKQRLDNLNSIKNKQG